MNYLVLHKQNMLFAQNHRSVDPKIHCDEFIFRRKFLTDKWQAIADKSPTLYQWLKDNIYGV
jgi:hypothetical protein